MPARLHRRVSTPGLAAAACLAAALACGAQSPQNPNGPGRPLPHNLRNPGSTQLPPIGPSQAAPPSTLPPMPPTTAPVPAANTLPGPIAATSNGTPSTRPHRATVVYADGQLNVSANDSSLNQILRAISRETGMTITGGVADQRVFGNYGPASASAVLATLLDGTGTNLLLREGDSTTPPELVLTPRGGGATPPSPSAVPDESIAETPPPPPVAAPPMPDAAAAQPVAAQPVAAQPVAALPVAALPAATVVPVNPALPIGNPIPPNNVNGSQYNTTPTASELPTTNSVPLDSLSAPTTTPAASGIVDSPNPPSGATPAPAAAGGPLTPEQVYQQLLQMQQKQAPPAAPAPPQ